MATGAISHQSSLTPLKSSIQRPPCKTLECPSRIVSFPLQHKPAARSSSLAKIPLAVSENRSVSSSVVSDRKKIINPIVVIDNYDSFTYNLCQYMGELGFDFEVYRNDELTVDELKKKNPRGILISPGPGAPQDSGISLQTVLELGPTVPLFGVCMGLQCIGEAFGGEHNNMEAMYELC